MTLYDTVLFIILGFLVVYCVLVTIALQLVNKDLERLENIIISRRLTMEPEKCRKCGNNVFEARHKGPHIGWYCTKCGAWLRWIPQHNKKAQLNGPHQMSIEKFMQEAAPEQMSNEELGITLPEERTQPAKLKLSSLYGEMQKDDDDNLPWE